MVNGLDIGVLNYFSILFPALLVFVLVFAILEKTKILGENKTFHAITAIVAAFLVMMSRDIAAIINVGAPWFIMVFVFLMFLLLLYRFMGASEEDLSNVIKTDKPIQWLIFAIGIIIVLASIANIYGQRLLEQEPGAPIVKEGEAEEGAEAIETSYREEIFNAIFHPKILGFALVILIAAFTIALLSKEAA